MSAAVQAATMAPEESVADSGSSSGASASKAVPELVTEAVLDRRARAVYQAHAPAIVRRLWRLVGDGERARELCNDTFVIAFERLASFRGDSEIATWLHGIAFNLARDEVTRRRRRRGLFARFFRAELHGAALPADGRVVEDELRRRLHDAMAKLDHDKREAYVLRVIEELALEECALLLSVPVSTVSYRARKAEEIVRAAFEASEEGAAPRAKDKDQ